MAGTLDLDIPATGAVDPGFWTGVGLRVAGRMVNCGTLAPTNDPDIRYRHDRTQYGLIDAHCRRIVRAARELERVYGYLADDGGIVWAVEMPSDKNSPAFEITRRIAQVCAFELRAVQVTARGAGALHTPGKGAPAGARRSEYYPSWMYGRRRSLGEPNEAGEPVLLLPNEHPDRKWIHELAVFDIAAFARDDPSRVHGVAA